MSHDKSKRTFLFLFSLVFLTIVIACCFHRHKSGIGENQEVMPELDSVLKNPSDDKEIFTVDFDANDVDTLMSKDYVFVSEPVPHDVRERMQNVSLPENAKIGFDDLRYN